MKVLQLGALWCPECLIMKPRWQAAAKTLPWLETEFIDLDERPEAKKDYQIDHVPTYLILNKAGQELKRFKGLLETAELVEILKEYENV